MNLFKKTTDIAIGNIDTNKAHGVAWVQYTDPEALPELYKEAARKSANFSVPFIADKPQLLVNPKQGTLKDIRDQLSKFGMVLKTIELKVSGETKVYAL